MEKEFCTAVVLAGGSGKRMGTKVHKQYLLMGGNPVIYYSLKAFQDSDLIDEIILVVGKGEEEYCRTEIVEKYQFSKVRKIVAGGSERYESVWNGIQAAEERGYIFIHDGARPFTDGAIIRRGYECVIETKACVAGMPSKDTIKVADEKDYVIDTPERKSLWIVQTPQVFEARLIRRAYSMLMAEKDITVTDDAMVVERMLEYPVKMYRGSYENIKITTPEDLDVAEVFLKK
ncbi:MAG TPA: 2-C-methyl-D-erythritol 4-phosphate cytidylyltransferase [Candidatus Mediterraneibacter stercoripullorum]|nr:2-C-methyl-D-erythritol 4-phosphate cytidylyltransferase [Candidatus Mediterraneibacter stercoripullorum]